MSRSETLLASAVSDGVLIKRIAAGDLESLGILFDRYEPEMKRVLAFLSSDPGEIDDLVQLTFLQVIRAAATYDARYPARRWLTGIAAMMTRRQHRSARRITARVSRWMREFVREDPITPDQEVGTREMEQRLSSALSTMSSKRREAFVLVAIEGLAGEEAAATLGIPLNTLWTRLHHARRDLRARLLGEE